ncbi:MAG TPA: SPOR domain-containing protein [Burkholderiaceae bacterium]
MGLFSFLQGSSASDPSRTGTPDPVQAARSRARRRLIGAAVLLGVGVIGFPLLFETQPRPIPVDIPIEIPRKEGAPTLPLPPPRTASAAPAVARVSSGVTTSESARPAPASSPAPAAARSEPTRGESATTATTTGKAAPPKAEAPKQEAPTKPEARADDGARARALLEGQTAENKSTTVAAAEPAKPAAANGTRFVVQVGAYGEASSARDMRQRVDKLGLKSYTQTAEVDGTKRHRVRVGPFNSRDEAEKAAGTLKAAGLPAAIMTL